jgi:hypothetical protein
MSGRAWTVETLAESATVSAWWAASGGELSAVLVDWDQRPEANHLALLKAAVDRASEGGAGAFAREVLARLHDQLAGAAWIPRDFGVAAAAVAVDGRGARAAWVGDVRVEVGDGHRLWTSMDHTLVNEVARKGERVPDDVAEIAPSILVRALGPINALDIEEHDFATPAVDAVALVSKLVHRHGPHDHRTWQASDLRALEAGGALVSTAGLRAE